MKGLVCKGENDILLILVLFVLMIVILLYQIMKRNKKIDLVKKTININHSDNSFESIKLVWITNIGDIGLNSKDFEKICDHNTIIILSGYSNKKSKKYNDENIRLLSSYAPVYFVWSDKDYSGNYRDLNALLLDCKVTILENTSASFETENGTKFTILGLDDVVTKRDNLAFALEEQYDVNFTIMASFSEVSNSIEKKYESIQVYLFERSQSTIKRNQKTIYLELRNEKGILKQNTISVINFKVVKS